MTDISRHHANKIESEVNKASIVKQVVKDRKRILDVVREALSNMCASEVGASEVRVKYYQDIDHGTTFIFEDDGCGMEYKDNLETPGRLDKFLHLGFSEVAGVNSDEFGYKGLGSKLLLDCEELIIESWTGDQDTPAYEVRADNPRKKLLEGDQPELPEFNLYEKEPNEDTHKGTVIEAKGYGGGQKQMDRGEFKQYLYYRTVVGCTNEDRAVNLPDIYLNYEGHVQQLDPGFPWIEEETDWRTVLVDPEVTRTVESSQSGTEVEVTLKGGFTLNTSSQKFSLSPHKGNVGLFVSVNDIPYFRVNYNSFTGDRFKNVYKKFTCFVIECDEIHEILSIDRSSINQDDDILPAFKKASRQAFTEFAERDEYQEFQQERRQESQRERAELLQDRKETLRNGDIRFVHLDASSVENGVSDDLKFIHRVPSGENDTLSLLWKLEALDALPFEEYTTLEHTANKGIDTIVNYQENDRSERHEFVACEIESKFENFESHGHFPGQVRIVICWEIEHPNVDHLTQVNDYKYRADFEEYSLDVYEIQKMPMIVVKQEQIR
jgi:hypothetical protein